MSDESTPLPELPWSGERYVPRILGNIRLEHIHRYLLAREWCQHRRVLDIACGEGYGSDILAAVARQVHGVDVSPEAVAHAQRLYGRAGVTFGVGDCAAIPLADASVDVVVSFETIEHHAQHDEMMREVRRVLAPGGVLIISSPDRREYSEIPQYVNPFHVKELSRDEFDALLRRFFPYVVVSGQRMKAGSVIWPLRDGSTQRFAGFAESAAHDTIDPLGPPLYLIAAASDAPLEPLPAGLLDGGEFVWSRDHVEAYREAEKLFHAHIAGVEQQRAEALVQAEGARAETERARADVERTRADAESARADARRAANDSERAKEDAQRAREGSERARTEHEAVVASLREALASEQSARASEREGARVAAGAAKVAAAAETARRLDALRASLAAERDHLAGDVARLATRVQAMETSTSWRVTAPIRVLKRAIDAGTPLTDGLSQAARNAYALLPLSTSARLALRSALFRRLPFLFRRTAAYRAWAAYQATAARIQRGGTTASTGAAAGAHGTADGALPPWYYVESSEQYVPLAPPARIDTRIKTIAFYLPQFHPIPENDRWWGKGFTEWTNVSRGKPQFVGHYQPHLPGELGFYDLRMPEIQRRQIELAKQYGIHGFCFHHYWFGGTRLLRRPFDQFLASPDMDMPFCLCWANENWSRRWDGKEAEILIAQQHSPADDLAFIRDIEPALRDPRYIRIDGRPLLVVYRPSLLPNARETAARWRAYCREAGLGDPFLVSTQAFDRTDPRDFGFDAAMEFAPNNLGAPDITRHMPLVNREFQGVVYDYQYLVEHAKTVTPPAYELFRSVTPMWDNEARRPGRGAVFANATPARYREALEATCRYTAAHLPDKPFVFLNAWNEWAEGAHLEPDRRYGYAYLQATADALRRFPSTYRAPIVCVSHDAHRHGAQLIVLNVVRALGSAGHDVESLLCGDGPLLPEFERVSHVHDVRPSAATPAERRALIHDLHKRGARIALGNTCAVGDTVEDLKQAGFTVVTMVHELPDLIRRHQLEESARKVATCADVVVFPAGAVRDRFLELTGMPGDRARVRPQGLYLRNQYRDRKSVARRELRALLRLDAGSPIVLGAGFADHRKGIDLFVEVGIRMADRLPGVRMVWVGHHEPNAMGQAFARVQAAGREASFLFPGVTPEPDVYFAGADVFLLTSREDPFPSVVLEALDVEVPVVAFDEAGGMPELLRRGCGVLAPFANVDAMAEASLRLLDDAMERDRLAAAGRRIIDDEFDFPSYARFLVGLGTPPRPTVSVVVPNYNYARHLPRRLESILEQTLRPDEIIFLDDASSDDSVAIAERMLTGSGIPFRVLRNETNAGCYPQWIRGLHEAAGDLVWIAEADDECEPTLLETLVPAFAQPEVVLAYCQSRQIDEHGKEIAPDYLSYTSDIDPDKWRHAYVRDGVDEIRDTLVVKNTIPNVSAVVMRRVDLTPIADRLVQLRNAGDWLVYLHVLEGGHLAFVPTALNRHRRHGGSLTIGKGGLNLMRELIVVQRYALERHAITPTVNATREAWLQTVYQYLNLHVDGPASYTEHQALRDVLDGGSHHRGRALSPAREDEDTVPVGTDASAGRHARR